MASIFLFLALLIALSDDSLGKVAKTRGKETCDKQRKLLTESYGTFSDGNKDYPEDSYCEWLITAPSHGHFITLQFTEMDTECSYDHIYVYDGNSYNSTLLGTFSGSTHPSPITARSGSMLVLLYSDTNYVRQGFRVIYSVTNCPLNCSGHGTCDSHFCVCQPLWTGEACDVQLCMDDCGESQGRGNCVLIPELARCVCNSGWSGDSCNLGDKGGTPGWQLLSQEERGLSGRAGHSSVYASQTDQLFVFGGFSFGQILGDLLVYSFNTSHWANWTMPEGPSPRWGHSMALYDFNSFVIFGGELQDGAITNDLWVFDIDSKQWRLQNLNYSPKLTKHSLTLVDFQWLYTFGGTKEDGSFSSDIYRINLLEGTEWEEVEPLGGKVMDRRIVGHSAEYHSPSKSLFIYGGITVDYARFSKLSNQIHVFNVEKLQWSRIHYPKSGGAIPLERAFHTMKIVGSYLVVFGGYTHRHSHEEICYDKHIYLYHLDCHRWVDFRKLAGNLEDTLEHGLFSHSMNLRQNALLITGGYQGALRGALWAFVLPDVIADDEGFLCYSHETKESCRANLKCAWCMRPSGSGNCIYRSKVKQECSSSMFSVDACPGLCSTLQDCYSCMIVGSQTCEWCPKIHQCINSNSTTACWTGQNTSWWGKSGTQVRHQEECPIKDTRPGLTSIKYRHPINWDQPDDVVLVNRTSEDLFFHLEFSRGGGGDNVARFLGYIHPFDVTSRTLKLYMRTGGGSAYLQISNSSSPHFLETVANHSSASIVRTEVHRPDRSPLFPNQSLKYLVDLRLSLPQTFNGTATMQLLWNVRATRPEELSMEYLEPYQGEGDCTLHKTCLACMVDNRCGWCNDSCIKRSAPCPKYLVIEPVHCPKCSDFIYCDQCAKDNACEWLIEEAHCVRRGRFEDAVRHPRLCSQECHLRSNCSSCLGDPGRCAWCEESQRCFLFATYTTSFMFGQCREWVDEDRANLGGGQCKDCSKHADCRSCLAQLSCGWCSNDQNPTVGYCSQGDFSSPHTGSCQGSSLDAYTWSYTMCPDIDECSLGLHSCHSNATCHNTPEAYICTCNLGFKGDGANSCVRTCLAECAHGICSEEPQYECKCNLGWTGEDCSINCGCNNHSYCSLGINSCDECFNWTEGEHCESCKAGSYGNATQPQGCQPCECNGHEDIGMCDTHTGVCYCKDNTEGTNCEKCKAGFYGDPRNGGHCYEPCGPREVVLDIKLGRLGSFYGSEPNVHCLWLLTVYSSLNLSLLSHSNGSATDKIQLAIAPGDIMIKCPYNHIYVYDGLPEFVAPELATNLLGALCGFNLSQPISLEARSGFMSIYFYRTGYPQGFNATYQRLPPAPSSTSPSTFDILDCPNNCSSSLSQGTCEQGTCHCVAGYIGKDCSISFGPDMFYSELVNVDNLELPLFGYSLQGVNSSLLLFGGYSLGKGSMGKLWKFEEGLWEEVMLNDAHPKPGNRHFHASTFFENALYIYGGIGEEGDVWEDFWKFDMDTWTWSQLKALEVPPLAGHTLTTLPEDGSIFLIGGYSPSYGFLEKVYIYNETWSHINVTGAFPIGLYGHSSVYHANSESIYVFGGIMYSMLKPLLSSDLYVFHLPTKQWSKLPPDTRVNPLLTRPSPLIFHTAWTTENYMIIAGVDQFRAYIYKCNYWLDLTTQDIIKFGDLLPLRGLGFGSVALDQSSYSFYMENSTLYKLSLPLDICTLFSSSRLGCIQHTGCSYCSTYENGVNTTFCYSTDIPSRCYNPKGTSEVLPGMQCTNEWLSQRDCYQFTSCIECVAVWPSAPDSQMCQWCSNCQVGRCIPAGGSCDQENDCNVPQRVVGRPSACPLHVCLASDCDKCAAATPGACMWTRQVLRSSEWGHTLNVKPIFDWTCVRKIIQDASSFPVESMPPLSCPAHCHVYTNCTECVNSGGGEGGWSECHWSSRLQQCISPSYEPLLCPGGMCGSLLTSQCSVPCWHHKQASDCLKQPTCGWCGFSGKDVDGRGLCMEGGLLVPTGGECDANYVFLNGQPLPLTVAGWLALSEGTPTWAYLTKPPENECRNGHHTCDEKHEDCVDTESSFLCQCKEGYVIEESWCKPVCSQGCKFGKCIQPDECECNFGYVGHNCSTECNCNGHSNCLGPEKLDECVECHNNTLGPQCQQCKPFFVGNPANRVQCIPCKIYCHGHSELCLGRDIYNATLAVPGLNSNLADLMVSGPLDEAVCVGCQNYTEGERCDKCMAGYFRMGENIKEGCRLCECNSHGDLCNPDNGENCNCHNNTENDRQCSQKNSKNMATPCWQLQCSKCKEYFLGVPVSGHQCYRHMFLDKDYCFDPNTQEECNRHPGSLPQGRTVFFAVQPRYMNVDIRIVVDVTEGGIDFFLSAKEDTFIVPVNKTSGHHSVIIDKKYGGGEWNETGGAFVTDGFNSTMIFHSTRVASRLSEYITLSDPRDSILVHNVQNRLVITIPQEVHDLRSTRFYMVLYGRGSVSSPATFGNIFFRQDQTRIDLFVFFSVFFSCFFLFLAFCVTLWKIKQGIDLRHARRLQAAEMKHMANRPFGHILAIIDKDVDEFEYYTYAASPCWKKSKHKGHSGVRDSPKVHAAAPHQTFCSIWPIAIEPIVDSFGGVATVMVQLPGGQCAPVKMCLGSTLVTMRSCNQSCGFRAAMRRRTSHIAL